MRARKRVAAAVLGAVLALTGPVPEAGWAAGGHRDAPHPSRVQRTTTRKPPAPPRRPEPVQTESWRNVSHAGHRGLLDGALDIFASLNANLDDKKYFDISPDTFRRIIELSRRTLRPQSVVGKWYCRTVKVERETVLGFSFFNCRISRRDGRLFFEKLTGSERRSGYLYEDDGKRLILLGATSMGEEPQPPYSGTAGRGPSPQDSVAAFIPGSAGRILAIFPDYDSYEMYELIK